MNKYFEGYYLNEKRWTGFQYGDVVDKRKFEIKNGNGFIAEIYTYKMCPLICIECEYKNGEKNGKAKERYHLSYNDSPDIEFEGEYLNGKKLNGIMIDHRYGDYKLKNGKGYIIDISNKCFYEGEFVNGEKNGKGKEYYVYNDSYERKILFQDEYFNGKRQGKGKEYYKNYLHRDNNLKFEGKYKCGF